MEKKLNREFFLFLGHIRLETENDLQTQILYIVLYLCISSWSCTEGQDAELQSLTTELSDHLKNRDRSE